MAEENTAKGQDPEEVAIAQTERIGLGDLVIGALIGAAAWILAAVWSYKGLPPSAWDNAAVAAWVRPATSIIPGVWTFVAQCVYAIFGFNYGELIFQQAAHVMLAIMAMLVYGTLRESLNFIMRTRPQRSPRRVAVMRLASIIGTLAFMFSDPVWNASQFLCHDGIFLMLVLLALETFFLFLRKGRLGFAYACAVFCGIIAAESPLGMFMPVLFASFYVFVSRVVPTLESPLFKPELLEVGKWHITFIYLVVLIVMVMLNCWTFMIHGGLGAIGKSIAYIPLAYVMEYWNVASTAATAPGWLLWTGVFFVPWMVSIVRFPSASDEERFLPYATGMVFFFCGLIAVSQVSFLHSLWFWTYIPIKSSIMLQIGSLMTATTIACAITILGVDSICRDHQRLVKQFFGSEDNDDDNADDDDPATRKAKFKAEKRKQVMAATHSLMTILLRRIGMVVIPVAIVAVMIPGRIKQSTRQMMALINDAIAETVREAKDVDFLFTDGNLDSRVELEATSHGKKLTCLSLVGDGSAMDAYLRTRGLSDDAQDSLAFGFDTGMGLRSWVRDRPERFKNAAVQMGFDLWKREGKPLPPMGGMMSLPAGFSSEEERQRGISAAYDMSERILALYDRRGGIGDCTDSYIKRAFTDVQWRLARMCKYRSEADDMAGRSDSAEAEVVLAKRLNDRNKLFRDMLRTAEEHNDSILRKLTPREGLQLALVRADFTMGKIYAEAILGTEPEDPDANFAVGMFYLKDEQYTRAERFLKRCLLKRPDEPAIYNNLAMIQMETGRFDAAEANIAKALKLAPEAAAVIDTKKALAKARAAAEKKAKEQSKPATTNALDRAPFLPFKK